MHSNVLQACILRNAATIFIPLNQMTVEKMFCEHFLSVCFQLNVHCKSTIVRQRDFIFGIHSYFTDDALSSDTKVNDLLTFTSTFMLKIVFFFTMLSWGA